ncbi:cell cycle-associated protein [Reticulomyxa filosa]|uniref:Cell cycle-associated protein n=1 Tax=Reticulomyxa filosa TaxID=46433 RepID=X6N0K1_RETFI|nr:cell cycle-associated protein [Reticulomyxa filosa]|eukprot:ETO19805.1 cell cycle-associated protein [Reticulomyxa filosa]
MKTLEVDEDGFKDNELDSETEDASVVKIKRRLKPGMKALELFDWPSEPYSKKQGLLANQEYIQEVIRKDPKNLVDILALPKTEGGVFTDKMQWLYEHFRQFLIDISQLLVHLQHVLTFFFLRKGTEFF